jgi:hypothetical protein
MWSATIDGEVQLLFNRKTENLLQRLKLLEMVE